MNEEAGDGNTPVRRSARARKPNSRFADDELDGCFKKIVAGVATPDSSTSSSSAATPTRQKKGGKKRESESEEIEANAPVSKESTTIPDVLDVVPLSTTKQLDVVNGLVSESEAPAESMGRAKSSLEKPKERRTRSNAKKDVLESLPSDDKKRTSKKGSKGKNKGTEEGKGMTKSESDVEKVNENLSEADKKKSDSNPSDSQAESSKNLTAVEAKLDGAPGKVKGSHEDISNDSSKFVHQPPSGWTEKENLESKLVNDGVTIERDNHQQSKESNVIKDTGAGEESGLYCDVPSPKQSENQESIVPGTQSCNQSNQPFSEKEFLSGRVENKTKLVDQEIGDCNTKETALRSNEHRSILPVSTKAQLKDISSYCALPEKLESSSDRVHSVFVKDRNVDFSEAETSTPSRLKGQSDTTEAEASTPARRRGRSNSSEVEPSTPTRRRGRSDSSGVTTASPSQRRGRSTSSEVNVDILPQPEERTSTSECEPSSPARRRGRSDSSGVTTASPSQRRGRSTSSEVNVDILLQSEDRTSTSECEPSSPNRRRGRSSKQPVKKSFKDEVSKSKESETKVTKKSVSGAKKLDISHSSPVQDFSDDPKALTEKGSSEINEPPQNVQSWEVDNDNKISQKLDVAPVKIDLDIQDSKNLENELVDGKPEDSLIAKGKRVRNEQSSEGGKDEQPNIGHQESPKSKKRRGVVDGTEFKQEGDQKRKRLEEPEEDVKRKKKKAEEEKEDISPAIALKVLPQEKVIDGVGETLGTIKDDSSGSQGSSVGLKESEEGQCASQVEGMQESKDTKEKKKSIDKIDSDVSPKSTVVVDPDVEEKRHSSVGNILSFLKRPDFAKNVEDSPDRKNRVDRKSPENRRRDDRMWKSDDRDRRSSGSTRRDERKFRSSGDEFPERKRSESDLYGRDRHSRERQSEGRYDRHRSDSGDETRGSRYAKDTGDISTQDSDIADSLTWGDMKDMTANIPIICESKNVKITKKVNETDSESKASEPKATGVGNVENQDVEEKRTSSIGNILSFLKRGSQSNIPTANRDDSQSPSEGSEASHSANEGRIFSFVESSRKSSYAKDDSYGAYGKREDDESSQKSKSSSKSKERRVSRWSAREETVDSHTSQWEQPPLYSKSGDTSASGNGNRDKWNEQRTPGVASFNKWDDVSSECEVPVLTSTKKEKKAKIHPDATEESYSMWSERSERSTGTWKGWTDNQTQGSFVPPNKLFETSPMRKTSKEMGKKTKEFVSDEENVDFGNRAGMSEFMESYADEFDQSTEDVSHNSGQSLGYREEIRQPAVNRESAWPTKGEMPSSPDREMYHMSRGKELNSPPRERVWSPRSNEIVLSPKSRELMSSLRNMEVKLTPQMQELISQNKAESVLPQELDHYPMKHDGEYDDDDSSSSFKRRKDGAGPYDIISIPLPSESDLLAARTEKDRSGSYGKSHRDTKQQMIDIGRSVSSQEGGRGSSHESSWRTHSERYDRSRSSRYDDNKSERVKYEEGIKEESQEDEPFERRSSYVEEIHDDKENLEPKVEDMELSEEEKLEYQRKIQRDLEAKDEKNKLVVDQRMKSFVHLSENLYIGDRKKSKRSKEVRRMVCDCSLTKEEISNGEVGCGEDCLNRLLMIECGSRCPLKDRCTNQRFQDFEYADVEVFNAEEKGCGVRVRKEIPAGTFVMEYVGEVFDSREFKRRRKEYSKNLNAHFYFMALKGDLFIDATRKGNISRFVNHSCDPNAQTQKWTVNGELRVGFFAHKTIEIGEEINFDYRLERYGREPQRCYCGTAICRGWLGESPDEKTKEEKEEEKRQERDRRKREEKRSYVEDIDLEDEIDKLNTIKLRTRQDILNLCRLMVRADNSNSRVMLLRLVQSSTSACKRLFMDYHGLSLLWSWMSDLGYAYEHASIKIEILKTLECLPITNKTQLTDSRVLGVVERWSTQSVEVPISGSPPPPPPPRPSQLGSGSASVDSDNGKKSSDTSEDSDGEMDTKPVSTIIDSSSVDDVSMDSVDVEQEALKSKPNLEGCLAEDDSSDSTLSEEKKGAVEPGEGDAAATATSEDEAASQELLILHRSMVELAIKLLEEWKDLKEYFRIPKKERIELMKEHEREVEEEIRGLDRDRKEKDKYRRDFDRRRRSPDREKDKDRHNRRSSRGDRDAREDRSSDSPKMSKEQRRQLFEIQVQQEEEEAKQRKMQEEMWAMHVERCRLLGQDPYLTPIFDPTCQYYWDPNTASWQPYNGTDPNIPVPAAYGYRPSENGDGSPMIVGVPPGHAAQPLTGHLAPDSEAATPNYDDPLIDLATIPLPGEVRQTSPTQPLPCQAVPVEGTPPQGARVLTFPVPAEQPGIAGAPASTMPVNINPSALNLPFGMGEEQPPPPPGPITIQLPPRWKMARDSEGHVYFYHVKSRTSQWEPPTLEQHQQLEAGIGSDSDSDSSSSDSDSTSTTDSEDFSSDEEEEEEEEQVTTVERGELCDEKMIRRHRAKKPRSESLVQERVISPVLEMDKEAARRERREAKERAQKEARQERQEDRLLESSQDDAKEDVEPITDKIQRMDRPETFLERERHDYREKSKGRDKTKSKERAATAIADNSDSARKCKESFRAKMATYIVSVLNPYRREDCKVGRITCNEDFKYLARKLTHFVMIKELKQLHSVEDLECNDSVKYKTKDFVRKYMSKYGHEFKRDPSDTKEY